MSELTIGEVYRAQMVLKDVARHPKIIGPTTLSDSCRIYLKPENLQHTGSFKLRGAYYKISQLSEEEKKRGVIACSAGNHAQGVALGATHNGIKSLILPSRRCPDFENRSHQASWRRGLPRARRLRRCLCQSA